MVVRFVIVGLIILALVDPALRRTSDDVTTVFVVDVSASMGAAADTGRSWVEAALTEADEAEWAIVDRAIR